MNHFHHGWGRPSDEVYGPYDHSYLPKDGSVQHTQRPMITGTSVVAIRFDKGVVIAADHLGSFGSLAKMQEVDRLYEFNSSVVLGFGGDISDMQAITRMLSSLNTHEEFRPLEERGRELAANNVYHWLQKLMYRRRTDINPLWNQVLVAGIDDKDKPFLSSVDLLATSFSSPCIATGFGAHLAVPILRRLVPDVESIETTTEEMAVEAIKQCMKVLFYRDARSLDRYSYIVITKDGVKRTKIDKMEGQNWGFAEQVRGYGTQTR